MSQELSPDLTRIKDDLLNSDGCSALAHAKLLPNLIDQMDYFRALNGQKSIDGKKEIFVRMNAHEDHTGSRTEATADPQHYATPYIKLSVGVKQNIGVLGNLFSKDQTLYSRALNLSTLKGMPEFELPQKCP